MHNAILIHGTCDKEEYYSDKYPSLSNSHWFPWLQKQLLMKNILAQTPEMPDGWLPVYEKWQEEFERLPVTEETILLGHSCGAGFLVRWLSENKVRVKKLILVAPWFDPNREKTENFFDFTIDSDLPNRAEIHILNSDNDYDSIHVTVDRIKESLPNVSVHEFHQMGHFCYEDMNRYDFPELLEILLK